MQYTLIARFASNGTKLGLFHMHSLYIITVYTNTKAFNYDYKQEIRLSSANVMRPSVKNCAILFFSTPRILLRREKFTAILVFLCF